MNGTPVTAVIVTRNTASITSETLRALERDRDLVDVLIVDAGSTDGTAPILAQAFPWARVLPARSNLGFTAGNNRALRLVTSPWVLLLNPDAIPRPGALREMVEYLRIQPTVGAVGPRLIYPDGRTQPSRRRFPTRATAFVESLVLQRWLGRTPLVTRFFAEDLPDDRPHRVDWVMGACILVRRAVLANVGLFDEGFFMYSEETDLCRRIVDAGWEVHYVPSAVVVHHEGKSSEQNLTARDLYFHTSRIRYYAKHHGRLWARLLRVAVLGHFCFLMAEEVAKIVMRRGNRDARLARIRSHAEQVRAHVQAALRPAEGAA